MSVTASSDTSTPRQEGLVLLCHVIPALFLIAAWALLPGGVVRAGRRA